MKKTKKKVDKPINIMEYIRSWEIVGDDETSLTLKVVLDAGGERNIKPDAVIDAFCERYPSVDADEADIHRREVFCKADDTDLIEIFA